MVSCIYSTGSQHLDIGLRSGARADMHPCCPYWDLACPPNLGSFSHTMRLLFLHLHQVTALVSSNFKNQAEIYFENLPLSCFLHLFPFLYSRLLPLQPPPLIDIELNVEEIQILKETLNHFCHTRMQSISGCWKGDRALIQVDYIPVMPWISTLIESMLIWLITGIGRS